MCLEFIGAGDDIHHIVLDVLRLSRITDNRVQFCHAFKVITKPSTRILGAACSMGHQPANMGHQPANMGHIGSDIHRTALNCLKEGQQGAVLSSLRVITKSSARP